MFGAWCYCYRRVLPSTFHMCLQQQQQGQCADPPPPPKKNADRKINRNGGHYSAADMYSGSPCSHWHQDDGPWLRGVRRMSVCCGGGCSSLQAGKTKGQISRDPSGEWTPESVTTVTGNVAVWLFFFILGTIDNAGQCVEKLFCLILFYIVYPACVLSDNGNYQVIGVQCWEKALYCVLLFIL